MKSMTGYGRGNQADEHYEIDIEMKSVNNRFLDLQFRMPKEVNPYEAQLRKLLKEYLHRGRIDIYITVNHLGEMPKEVVFHWDLASQLIDQLHQGALQNYGETSFSLEEVLYQLATHPDYSEIREVKETDERLGEALLMVMKEAVANLAASRQEEGAGIELVLKENKEQIARIITQLQSFVAIYEKEFQERYAAKLKDYLGDVVDKDRLLTEMAILLEKGDIHEELDRLAIHLRKFDQLMAKNGPVGRELDFLVQEMNREVNTIGSKSSAIEIKDMVVQLKTSLEKIREQIQNVE